MCGSDAPPPGEYRTQAHLVPDGELVVEPFPVTCGGYTYPHGRIAYIRGAAPAPVVLVHHNYAGCKEVGKRRTSYIAQARIPRVRPPLRARA